MRELSRTVTVAIVLGAICAMQIAVAAENSPTATWSSESDQPITSFGAAVCGAGDVNGDGYDDVIVGAPLYDNGQADEGRVFVYHGSQSGLSSIPAWHAESDQAGAIFGISVSGAGDVNGDGYDDVIVGAYLFDNGESDEGRAYLYYGSPSGLSAAPDWSTESNQANSWFGGSVSTAGDVNGDGYDDLIIGAEKYDFVEGDEGRAFVYYGSPSGPLAVPSWIAQSNQIGATLGVSVATAGDVNADGYDDVIVGANRYNSVGRAYVFHGSPSGPSFVADWTVDGQQTDAFFASAVSAAGDVNGDGYDDVIVGAFLHDGVANNGGRASVFLGSPSGLSTTVAWSNEGTQSFAQLGRSVARAGDVNGDGFDDVIIAAHRHDNGEIDEGLAFVFNGSLSGLSLTPDQTAEIDQASAWFGYAVSTAGDVDNDGFDDLIVGAMRFDNGELNEGAAFVYSGEQVGCLPPSEAVFIATASKTTDCLGCPVLHFDDPNPAGGVTGYNVYRSDDPIQLTFRVALDATDENPLEPGVQWIDDTLDISPTGIWYFRTAAYNHNCVGTIAEGP